MEYSALSVLFTNRYFDLLWDKEQTFDSVDAVMNTPFFDGKSLAEVCHETIL